MKTNRILWCVISGFALATTAYAGNDSKLQMMDTDGDGSVSATEHAAGAKKMFTQMDADADGIVTAQEMDSGHKDKHAASSSEAAPAESNTGTASRLGKSERGDKSMTASAKIKKIDTDGDGAISAAEHEAGSKKMFEKMDKDHSGKLSAAELQAGHERMMTAEEH